MRTLATASATAIALLAFMAGVYLAAASQEASAAEARYRGLEDQNQRVRLVYDKAADRLAFRIGFIADCVGTGGENEGQEFASLPLMAKPPNGTRVRVARDGTFVDRLRFRVDRKSDIDGGGRDEVHRRMRVRIAGQLLSRGRANGTIRVRYTEVRISRNYDVVLRYESRCDSDVRRWRAPRFRFRGEWRPTGANPVASPEFLLPLSNGQLFAFGANSDISPTAPRVARYLPAQNRWRRGRAPSVMHHDAVAVVLGDGRVLVAGGSPAEYERAQRTAELYNPRSARWLPTGRLTTRRAEGARAELLSDGRALIVGGTEGHPDTTTTASAEIFDPESGRFTETTPMPAALNLLHCAALPSGGILCLGDARDGAERVVAFDPASETWSPVEPPPEAELISGAIELEDGRIFATGRVFEGETRRGVAAIYTEGVGWTPASSPPAPPLVGRDAVLLPSGRVLVPLDELEPGDFFSQRAATYDPATDTWEFAEPYFFPYSQYPYFAPTPGGALFITAGPTGRTRTERFFE